MCIRDRLCIHIYVPAVPKRHFPFLHAFSSIMSNCLEYEWIHECCICSDFHTQFTACSFQSVLWVTVVTLKWLTKTLNYFTQSWQGAGCDTLRTEGRGTLQQTGLCSGYSIETCDYSCSMATLMSPRMMCAWFTPKPGQIMHRAFYSS